MVNDNKIIREGRDSTDTQEVELEQLRLEKEQAEKEKENEKAEKKGKKSEKKSGFQKASVSLFLKKELNNLKNRHSEKPYDFEEEYSKTKKNKTSFIPVTLVLCSLGIAGLIYGTYSVLERIDLNVDLSDGLLEEVNVEDLADEVTRTTVMYENSLKNIKVLQQNLEAKLTEAKKQYDFNLYVIDSMNIEDKREIKNRKASAKADYKKAVDEINQEAYPRIEAARKESEGYKKRLEDYEQQQVKNLSQDEETDEKTVLARLERERIIRDYETQLAELRTELNNVRSESQADKEQAINTLSKKYQDEIAGLDPELNDKEARSIIASAASLKAGTINIGKFTDKAEKIRDIHLRAEIRNAQSKYENYEYLNGAVKSLPQKHSIPEYVKASNKLVVSATNEIVEAAVESVNNLSDKLEAERSEKEVMENAVSSLLISQGKKAVVIKGFDDKLRLYVTQEVLRRIQKDDVKGFVMLGDKKIEGSIVLKSGIIYFMPDAVDLSEEIANFTLISIGTEVEIL